ncbi:MAG: TonB-dependent receptor [Saprospiraceae bacterium]|nr:TonB-dependent receptor [Saprospiraceae bacterium]
MLLRLLVLYFLLFISHGSIAQYELEGRVTDQSTGAAINNVSLFLETTSDWQETTKDGTFSFQDLETGSYILSIFADNYSSQSHEIILTANTTFDIQLDSLGAKIEEIKVIADENELRPYFRAVEGMAIYHARKTEVIHCDKINGNLANNSGRQIYAKTAGLNIWENDNSGIQLNIGGRGLSPDRTANFNTKQNGYDISADALGYPETYYIPPAQSLKQIQVIRGAASLQYGTQFGGLLNFITKEGNTNKSFNFRTDNSYGSNNFISSFTSFDGSTADNKLKYYSYYQFKRGDGWRDFSEFTVHNGYAGIRYSPTQWLDIKLEQTVMNYVAQQPGGLTDQEFAINHRQAKRPRNWFRVNWNITALDLSFKLSERTKINNKTFFLLAGRQSLGNLQPINRVDYGGERDMIKGQYRNIGNETRLMHNYTIKDRPIVALIGARVYKGFTTQTQDYGNADSTGTLEDFTFINSDGIFRSDYKFPSFNFAAFAENYFSITDKFGITPGIRFEYIQTASEGTYQDLVVINTNMGLDTLKNEAAPETRQRKRAIVLLGIGMSYKPTENTEIYSNFSQNYRAINFNDMRILNPNQEVDPNLRDEKGFNADFGFRGVYKNLFNFDITLFYLSYQNRIGNLQSTREDPENTNITEPYILRSNIGNARVLGFESLVEMDVLRMFKGNSFPVGLRIFNNFTILDGRYTKIANTAAQGNRLELVAPVILRAGMNLSYKNLQLGYQYSYTHKHFTDATNAEQVSNAVTGIVPSYGIMDLNLSYKWKWLKWQFTISNLSNSKYFTRRASSYPGPGILPGDGISFYGGLQIQLGALHKKYKKDKLNTL